MALKIEKCEIIETSHSMVSTLVSRLEEGTALVYVMEGGKARVKGSTGVAGEKFAGVANSRHVTPSVAVSAITTRVPAVAPFTIELLDTPKVGDAPGVTIAGVAAAVGAALGQYAIAGKVITFNAGDAGKTVAVTYRYELSQRKAMLIYGGDALVSDMTGDFMLARITTGVIYTDRFVTADNWADPAAVVKLGADGMFTTAGAGTTLNAIVEELPQNSNGFLGIRLNP
jgi:hypothetical protein